MLSFVRIHRVLAVR